MRRFICTTSSLVCRNRGKDMMADIHKLSRERRMAYMEIRKS